VKHLQKCPQLAETLTLHCKRNTKEEWCKKERKKKRKKERKKQIVVARFTLAKAHFQENVIRTEDKKSFS